MMSDKSIQKNKINILRKIIIVIGWLLLWQGVSAMVKNPIFFPSPIQVTMQLKEMLWEKNFYISILFTLIRIMIGFFGALLCAYILAICSGKYSWIKEILEPVIIFFKSVPVVAIIVLLLIWFGAKGLACYVTFMVVFPNIYINVLEGYQSASEQMLEMAKVYQFGEMKRYWLIYRPAIWGYLISGIKYSIGMSFKSGVAAEVIGLTEKSIGERLYFDKIYLNTAGVFGWAIVIILISMLAEKLIVAVFTQLEKVMINDKFFMAKNSMSNDQQESKKLLPKNQQESENAPLKNQQEANKNFSLKITALNKKYQDKILYRDFSFIFQKNHIYGIMGDSGNGKTTLLRIIAGLENADEGNVQRIASLENEDAGIEQRMVHKEKDNISDSHAINDSVGRRRVPKAFNGTVAFQFQEDRLFENLSAEKNILYANHLARQQKEEMEKLLVNLFGAEWTKVPVSQLSGGMKRRVALLRALYHESEILLLDEPFTGLDEASKMQMIELVKRLASGKIVVVATHDTRELDMLGVAEIIEL